MIYKIVEMQTNELKETLELVKYVLDEFEAPYYTKEGIQNFYNFIDYNNTLEQLNNHLKIFVVKNKEKIIGMICIRDYSHIAMLFVDKNYHKKGIGTDLINKAKDIFEKEILFNQIQKTSNNTLNNNSVEVYGEKLNKALIGVDFLLGRKSTLINYLQKDLANMDKNFYEYNDNEKEDFKQKTEKILNELMEEKNSLEPIYLYIEPLDKSYKIANSNQTINKLNELNTEIKEFTNANEESEEDEI